MIWAVKCRIDANRDTNSEIIKAETIVIIYEWHSSPQDDVAHITLHSRNLDGDRTGSYHGYRPGEQKLYRTFFKWAKNLPASVETPSEGDISRMPPALFEHWQDSGQAFGHWLKKESFLGNKPKRVSMVLPITLFDYWHQTGSQDDSEENIARLYSLYQDWKASPADSKMLRPVIKPLAKPGENPCAYTPGGFGYGIQPHREDRRVTLRANRPKPAVEEGLRTQRTTFLANRAVAGHETRHPAVPSGVSGVPFPDCAKQRATTIPTGRVW